MRALVLVGAALLAACSKGEAGAEHASGAPSASAGPAASAPVAPVAKAPAAPQPTVWSGKYTATHGALFVPDGGEWAGVKFRGDDASTSLGDGTLKVTIAPGGHAQGSLDGALGELGVEGVLSGNQLTASLVPKEPNKGLSGTLVGEKDGAKVTGTLRAASPKGDVIREASFALDEAK